MSDLLTVEELAEIRGRCEKATGGEWLHRSVDGGWDGVEDSGGMIICKLFFNHPPNATFIAHSHTDIPHLLELVEALQKENHSLRCEALTHKNRYTPACTDDSNLELDTDRAAQELNDD